MRKLLALTAGAILAVAVTGTITAQILQHGSASFTVSDSDGHVWNIHNSYRGEIQIFNPQGKISGVTRNLQRGTTVDDTVEVTYSGEVYHVHGAGRHDIRNSEGVLRGYVVLKPMGDQEYRQEAAKSPQTLIESLRRSEEEESKFGGVSGMSASPLGANGWDKQLGMSWKVRGQVNVIALTPQGHSVGQVAGAKLTDAIRRQLPPDALPPRVPRVEITVNGKMRVEQGYGYHDIKNDAGKLLMRLDVKPLPGVHDDKQNAPTGEPSKGSDTTTR